MIKIKTLSLTVIFALFLGTKGFALVLETLLPQATLSQLLQSGAIDRETFDSGHLGIVPNYSALRQFIAANRQGIDPNIVCESLRLYKKPASDAGDWTARQRRGLFNGMLSISSLAGLQYFSKSRNAMRLFYETAQVIDGPDTRNPRPDPAYSSPPPQISLFARLKDLTFGDNIYKFTYTSNDSSFMVLIENASALSYGPVQVIGKNNLRSVIAVIDCGPYLLVYTASLARSVLLPGMKQRVANSVSSRAEALLGWFTQKANKAFGGQG